MSSSKVPDLSLSNLVKWLNTLYPGYATRYAICDNCISRAFDNVSGNVPAGIDYETTDVMLERIPIRAAIWDLKPKSFLAVRIGDMLTEVWDSGEDSPPPIVSLICSDSSMAGKDSLFLVVATATYEDGSADPDFNFIPFRWYTDHNATPRIVSGSTTYVNPYGEKQKMAVIALQLSSYK